MPEATDAVREPRYWKITVNPEECPEGAWAVCRAAALAMLGLPGEEGEANYAVRNMKRLVEGDWLVAYTPQEGPYTVGGIGRVTRGYRCEEGPFTHPWNGPVRRSVAVEWYAGACRITDLVKEGRFRKGKIPRVLDEISAAEFAAIRELVAAAAATHEEPEVARPGAERPEGSAGKRRAAEPEIRAPEPGTVERELEERGCPAPRPSPMILDPCQEQPPLPQFFLDWAREENVLGPDLPAGTTVERRGHAASNEAARTRSGRAEDLELSRAVASAGAAIRRSREGHLLGGLESREGDEGVLDFGLPTIGGVEGMDDGSPCIGKPATPSEVRVGATGWTGLFRREVESGRPCSLLLRGPQYSFLNMTPAGSALRGLPLFALFAIGAVSAPGKEAFRGGARFIFRGRRACGDYEVEVRPRRVRPVFREPVEMVN